MSQDNGHERPKKDVALFLDFENVYISVRQVYNQNPNFEAITEKAEEYGRVIISRAYADWYRWQRITNALYANGIEPVYVPTYYYGQNPQHANAIKNSVDIHLVIDAMRTLYTHSNIETYVFVTGDRDFIPLMNAIRQYGKECIVIGVAEAASSHLAQSADEFYFYHQLVEDLLPEVKIKDPFDGLVEALKLAKERKTDPTFATVKLLMQEAMGSFDERRVKGKDGRGFSKFKDFVREAEKRGLVKVYTSGTSNLVLLPDQKYEDVAQIEPETDIDIAPIKTERPERTERVERERSNGRSRYERTERAPRTQRQPTPPEVVIAPIEEEPQPQPELAPIPLMDELDPNDPASMVIQAIHLARRRNNLCTMATLKVLVKELYPEFEETQYSNESGQPYGKFKELVEDAAKGNKVQILTTGTIDEVFLRGEDAQKLSRFANRGRRVQAS